MAQKTNDQIILEQIIKERCAESGDELTVPEYFEIYSASEILKNHDLTYDDILYGIPVCQPKHEPADFELI
ncbi:hypothetical protein GCM10011502_29810 [Oceanisphaera marina]|uniref:Uncharacterized protein n=1 Tax=Oceanisphaera marina TaxID=2017550 RepID=A0ABQ1IZ79_9GAMM|nr:hypothetical protein GCM10011502_29810 [Oceanisphaera marina]